MRRADVLNTLAALVTAIWIAGCADTTMPQAQPGGPPSDVYRMGTVTATAQCDPYLSLDWCADEGECMTLMAAGAAPTAWESTCGTPAGGGTGNGGGTGSTGAGGLTGDDDGDGDTLNEVPIAFVACMAVTMGLQGGASLTAAGLSAYAAWDARNDARAAYDRYKGYNDNWGKPGFNTIFDKYLYDMWKEAEEDELQMYVAFAAAGGWAAAELIKAARLCAPTWGVPA